MKNKHCTAHILTSNKPNSIILFLLTPSKIRTLFSLQNLDFRRFFSRAILTYDAFRRCAMHRGARKKKQLRVLGPKMKEFWLKTISCNKLSTPKNNQ